MIILNAYWLVKIIMFLLIWKEAVYLFWRLPSNSPNGNYQKFKHYSNPTNPKLSSLTHWLILKINSWLSTICNCEGSV